MIKVYGIAIQNSAYATFVVGWLVDFYGISTFVGYVTPNQFLCKLSVLFQTIQFSICTQFKCKYSFIVKTFLFQAIQFNQTIQFNICIPLVLFIP